MTCACWMTNAFVTLQGSLVYFLWDFWSAIGSIHKLLDVILCNLFWYNHRCIFAYLLITDADWFYFFYELKAQIISYCKIWKIVTIVGLINWINEMFVFRFVFRRVGRSSCILNDAERQCFALNLPLELYILLNILYNCLLLNYDICKVQLLIVCIIKVRCEIMKWLCSWVSMCVCDWKCACVKLRMLDGRKKVCVSVCMRVCVFL